VTPCGAGVSDHFSALLGAGIAVFTALTVSTLSAIFEGRRAAARRAHELLVEESKRQHEAAVRFHDERLSAYIDFLSVVSTLFARGTGWVKAGAKEPFTKNLDLADVLTRGSLLRPSTHQRPCTRERAADS
jgi:hypothetical protein